MASATVAAPAPASPKYERLEAGCPACPNLHTATVEPRAVPGWRAGKPMVVCPRCIRRRALDSLRPLRYPRPVPAAGPEAARVVEAEAARLDRNEPICRAMRDRLLALAEQVRREDGTRPGRFDVAAVDVTPRALDAIRATGRSVWDVVEGRFLAGDFGIIGKLDDAGPLDQARELGAFAATLDRNAVSIADGEGPVVAEYHLPALGPDGKTRLDHPAADGIAPGRPGVFRILTWAFLHPDQEHWRGCTVLLRSETGHSYTSAGY